MLIYHYSNRTGEFLGEGIADESPLEPGVFLIPAFATASTPPATEVNQVAVFAGSAWEIKSDHRGGEYWLADGSRHSIMEIGEEYPEDALFAEPEQEPVIPVSITPRQGLIMLSRSGLLATVNAAIDGMEGQAGEEARIDFDRANEWRRDWPLLNALAGGLGLTDEQIDQLFITAATL